MNTHWSLLSFFESMAGPEPYVASDFIRSEPTLPKSMQSTEPRRLRVREAIEVAVANNLDVTLTGVAAHAAERREVAHPALTLLFARR